jgi:sugar/nucleoside kinase (ribokinase family)
MDLICVGDVMVDVRAAAERLRRAGDVHGRVRLRPGGSSANAAVWAASGGASVAVVAAVGSDLAGELSVGALRERGVDVTGVVRRDLPTGVMLVVTERDERSMAADRGANASLTPDDLPRLEAGAVLVSGYLLLQEPGHEVALAAFDAAAGSLLAVEAASWPLVRSFGAERFFRETAGCDAVLANEREARELTGREGAEAARELGARYRVAAVKLGPRGAVLVHDGEVLHGTGPAVDAVDPTGAGDAFDGVLLAALARGRSPRDAIDAACRAGALVAAAGENWPVDDDVRATAGAPATGHA